MRFFSIVKGLFIGQAFASNSTKAASKDACQMNPRFIQEGHSIQIHCEPSLALCHSDDSQSYFNIKTAMPLSSPSTSSNDSCTIWPRIGEGYTLACGEKNMDVTLEWNVTADLEISNITVFTNRANQTEVPRCITKRLAKPEEISLHSQSSANILFCTLFIVLDVALLNLAINSIINRLARNKREQVLNKQIVLANPDLPAPEGMECYYRLTDGLMRNPLLVTEDEGKSWQTIDGPGLLKMLSVNPICPLSVQNRDKILIENKTLALAIQQYSAYPNRTPAALFNPTTAEFFNEPVVASDGKTYEKAWLLEYFDKARKKSALHFFKRCSQGLNLKQDIFYRNMAMEKAIAHFKSLSTNEARLSIA